MTSIVPVTPNPTLDLVLERTVDVPPEKVWAAWTQPEHLRQWFAPRPWTIADCEVDLRPGGIFKAVLRSPEGEEMPSDGGCILEVIPNERLVWTDALGPGYRPSKEPFFSAAVLLEPSGTGTKYTAIAIHRDEVGREQHEAMGFHEGWGQVLEQMVEYTKGL